jgi:hypothetical protein
MWCVIAARVASLQDQQCRCTLLTASWERLTAVQLDAMGHTYLQGDLPKVCDSRAAVLPTWNHTILSTVDLNFGSCFGCAVPLCGSAELHCSIRLTCFLAC